MDFIRRSSYSKNGRSNKPYTYDDTLEKIDLGSDHRTKPAESELSPIREEPRSGGSLTSPLNEAWASSVSSAEIMTKKQSPTNTQSISDWGSPPPGEKRLPDTAYPALEPRDWISETPFLIRDRDLGRGTSPATFAESLRPFRVNLADEHTVDEQVHKEYNRYLKSANTLTSKWEETPQISDSLVTVEEDLALQLAGRTRPRSPRDYWETVGAIRRKHFDEFKALKEQNERSLGKLVFRAGRKIQDLQMQMTLKEEELAETEKRILGLQARVVQLEALGIREKKLADSANSRIDRTPLEKVYKNDYSSRHDRKPLADLPSTRKFLYDDTYSQNVELVIETALQRADLMWKLQDWNKMYTHGRYAHTWAKDLKYKPLMQRCHFYLGVAAFGQERFEHAAECFEWAGKCRNYYYEGELVGEWHIRAKREVQRRKDPNFSGAERFESDQSEISKEVNSKSLEREGLKW